MKLKSINVWLIHQIKTLYKTSSSVISCNPGVFKICLNESEQLIVLILRRKKDGDWYIYPWFLTPFIKTYRNVVKSSNLVNTMSSLQRQILQKWGFLCVLQAVRFALRHYGKMYSRHLFSYGGFKKARKLYQAKNK